jgi:hypothetical protein
VLQLIAEYFFPQKQGGSATAPTAESAAKPAASVAREPSAEKVD